jgi:hypothetical protein
MALGLNFSLAMFMVTSLFSSVAYHSMITVLSGFTVALLRLWETQNQSQAISIPAAPAQLRRAPALRAS